MGGGQASASLALRPPQLNEPPADPPGAPSALCLALDVGGSKLAVALADPGGDLLWQDRIRTPRATGPEPLFQVVADLVRLAEDAARGRGDIAVCGVGCGGPMSAHGEAVSPLNIPAWRDFPLRSRLRGMLGALGPDGKGAPPVFVDNDAKALALGEGWLGAARGHRHYLAMVVSTGIGAGIVLDGRLLEGASGNAGHIGHLIVEPDGRTCTCGARGCLEAEASGTAIEAATGAPAEAATPDVVERSGRLVGRAVASVANLLDLPLAVVAGSVALGYGPPFFAAAQRELDDRARIAHARGCRIVPAGLGHDGPLVGAAAVGWLGLGKRAKAPRP